MTDRKVINLYEHYKNNNKKLKIVCDWDEVIQACEPFACYLETRERFRMAKRQFPQFYNMFWGLKEWKDEKSKIDYSPYGSKLKLVDYDFNIVDLKDKKELKKRLGIQQEIKNSPNFYQQAPFLAIAEDLLKLIKENKVEKLIFLSAYDKNKFPDGDERKKEIFKETFGKLGEIMIQGDEPKEFKEKKVSLNLSNKVSVSFSIFYKIELQLIPFESSEKGQSKADWIKENASDFDIVIDDNPNICRSLVENNKVIKPCYNCAEKYKRYNDINCKSCEKNNSPKRNCGKCGKILTIELVSGYEMNDDGVNIGYAICQNKNCQKECDNFWKVADVRESYNNEEEYWNSETDYTNYPTTIIKTNKPPITVLAPYYPAIEHDKRVILVKNEVSSLGKEDFSK